MGAIKYRCPLRVNLHIHSLDLADGSTEYLHLLAAVTEIAELEQYQIAYYMIRV